MKIVAIGDIHGRTSWKKIVEKENEVDTFIFMGDYFDSKEDLSSQEQIENFEQILNLKRLYSDRVVLLFGNHDFHYLPDIEEHYGGYQEWSAFNIQDVLKKALDENLLQMCFIHEQTLFSHAGVTDTWCRNNDIDKVNLVETINDLFKYKTSAFKFTSGRNFSNTGDDVTQSPIWVRKNSLQRDRIEGYLQVVRHTIQKRINLDEGGEGIVMIDALATSGEYLIIVDNTFYVGKIQ